MTKGITDLKSLLDIESFFPERALSPEAEVVRIAPSPTGMPHIGTAIQAVINKAIAEKTKGVFILRIEDTDRSRFVPEAEKSIIEGLDWLGMRPDEGPSGIGGSYGPYKQSERLHLYKLAAEHLVSTGHAYHCFCSSERLDALRLKQQEAKTTPKYDRKCLELPASEVSRKLRTGEKSVIRLKIPDLSHVSFRDEVRGNIGFETDTIDDPILMKSDGYPTYHLAAVVDDHFMRVTTVVRGEEWISSTPKHILLYRAFGWTPPKFLHTVLLRDEQRRKLSKRSGDTSLDYFQKLGYLPDGFRNFLTRIMWAHPQGKDIYGFAEFAKLFQTRSLPKTGPIVDMKLLDFINGQYLKQMSPAEVRKAFVENLSYLEDREKQSPSDADVTCCQQPEKILHELKKEITTAPVYSEKVFALEPERNHKLSDIICNSGFFFETTFVPPQKDLLEKHCPDENVRNAILLAARDVCSRESNVHDWDSSMRQIAQEAGVKPKTVFMLSRLAITGAEKTPPLFEIIQIMGDARIKRRMLMSLDKN